MSVINLLHSTMIITIFKIPTVLNSTPLKCEAWSLAGISHPMLLAGAPPSH
ncbi:hypothetical protein HCEG_06524 [Histoplasma capsulatum var. duboisii H88]|uniref:Uncharacterized protein n=1 Tax=Ajellomyces capsulatus (strain H88) TaxID=544711 RepID=F0UMG5_AJEC8|nr:hypothetical protein HCEG_06524 [Histoplasma capsulatum var. duboisii H88]